MSKIYDDYCKDCKFFVPDDPQNPHLDHIWGACTNLYLMAHPNMYTWPWTPRREDSGCSAQERKEVRQ